MNKQKLQPKDIEKMSEENLELINKFNLIDYCVHIKSLADNYDCQAYQHLATIPSVCLKDVKVLECTLDYPLNEEHTFQISINKIDDGKMVELNVDDLLFAVAKEYKMLWRKQKKLFWGHSWEELYIDDLILTGDKLIPIVGS